MNNNEVFWHVLKVKPQHELKVVSDLKKLGLAAYTPFVEQWHCWSDRKKKIKKPLISRHVFVQVSPSQDRLVFNSQSVNGYLNVHGQRAKVWPNEIQRLKDYCMQAYSPSHLREGAIFKAPILGTDAQLLSVGKNNMCSAISSCGRFTIKFKLAS